MTAKDLQKGDTGIIQRVSGQPRVVKRLSEMGFVKGKVITYVQRAPLRGPMEFQIMNSIVIIRKSEAECVEIEPIDRGTLVSAFPLPHYNLLLDEQNVETTTIVNRNKEISIALVGNPNTGKTSIFNNLSGIKGHVGNYAGVTVDFKITQFDYDGHHIRIIDLPGTYSLHQNEREEQVVREYLLREKPDLVVNVVEASNIERNLFLTTQLIDMGMPMIIALNMYDELEKSNIKLNHKLLEERLHTLIIPTVGKTKQGVQNLLQAVVQTHLRILPKRRVNIHYPPIIEGEIELLSAMITPDTMINNHVSVRYLSIAGIEKEFEIAEKFLKPTFFTQFKKSASSAIKKIEKELHDDSRTVMIDWKYTFIGACLTNVYEEKRKSKQEKSKKIDNILTNKYFGLPILLGVLFLMFHTTFSLGQYPTSWLESGMVTLAQFLRGIMQDSMVKNLLVDGIIGGLGSVLTFLPNIVIVFMFISLLEDTGYMARTTFIMDKLMHNIGLHGKSFIPMLLGFGCNVPAILATRMLENKKDRILTVLIIPFMVCSARLPIFILLISFISPDYPTIILFSLYFFGIIMAILSALLFNKFFFTKHTSDFIVELPPYRLPRLRNSLFLVADKVTGYLKNITPVVVVASVIIWGLGYFPRSEKIQEQMQTSMEEVIQQTQLTEIEKTTRLDSLATHFRSEQIKYAYIGRLGKIIEPILEPMGFDWKMGVALISGISAKEVVISTMAILYSVEEENLGSTLQKVMDPQTNKPFFSPTRTLAFLLFTLLYFPCISVIFLIRREIGTKWALLTVLYSTTAAGIVAFLCFRIGNLLIG